MLNGTLQWTNDLGSLTNFPGYTILNLAELDNFPPMLDILPASILLPPYEASMLQLDGMLREFEYQYIQYLESPDVRRWMSMLFKGLLLRKNFIIYIGKDEMELPFFGVLCNYFATRYGIIIGGPTQSYSHNTNNPAVIETLFEFGWVDHHTFLMYFPLGVRISEPAAYKLAVIYGMIIPGQQPTGSFSEYFTRLRNGFQYGELVMHSPVQMVKPE